MDYAAAVPGTLAGSAVNQCPECGGVMFTLRSRIRSERRLRRFQCKSCGHRLTTSEGRPCRKRKIDSAAVGEIRRSDENYHVLAAQYGCSRELIRQIRNGQIYRDLLPEWFRAPAKAGDPTCEQCEFYVKAKQEQLDESCSLDIPEFETQGVRAAWDCSAFADHQQPANGAA